MKFPLPRRALFAEPVEWPGPGMKEAFALLAGKAAQYLIAYRQAKAAAHLYERLSRMSNSDLARIGMQRQDIMRQVRERLDLPT